MTDSTRSGEETGRAAPYEGTQPSGTTDSRSSSPDNSAAKVGRTRRWNALRSEIAFQGFGWWLLRLLRGQRTYGWKLWKP